MLAKHAPKLLVLLLALLITGGILAAKAPAEPKQYDYVTVVYYGGRNLSISYGSEKCEQQKVEPKGGKDSFNFTPLLSKINELESQGYELVENHFQPSSTTSILVNYVLMRKPR